MISEQRKVIIGKNKEYADFYISDDDSIEDIHSVMVNIKGKWIYQNYIKLDNEDTHIGTYIALEKDKECIIEQDVEL